MLKFHAAICYMVFVVTPLFAQDYVIDLNYTVGKPYKVVDADRKMYFNRGGDMLTLKIRGREAYIQKFNSQTLAFKGQKVYKDLPDHIDIESVRSVGDHFYLFYSLWDKQGENEQLFYREIDYAAGTFKGDPQLLIKVPGKVTGRPVRAGMFGFRIVDKFHFYTSYNYSKLMIRYRQKPDVKNDSKSHDIIGMYVFDEAMNIVWKDDITMPYTEEKMDNFSYEVDDAGNVYLLARVYNDNTADRRKTRGGPTNYHFEVLKLDAGTTDMYKIREFPMGKHFTSDMTMNFVEEDVLAFGGYFNNGDNFDDIDGVIGFTANLDAETITPRFQEIPLSVLNSYASGWEERKNERKDEKEKAQFENLELDHTYYSGDGSVTTIGEQYYTRTHTSYSNGRERTYYTYHYEDILVANTKADGSLGWMLKLPKRQKGKAVGGTMSYYSDYDPSTKSYQVLFMDNEKNNELTLEDKPKRYDDGEKGILVCYSIDAKTGDFRRTVLFDLKDVNGYKAKQFNVGRILSVGDGEYVIEVYKGGKQDVLIKVKTGNQ